MLNGYNLLKQDKHIAFVSTGAVIARALVEKAFKLSKPDNSPIKLDCIAYISTVEVGISFEITSHFDIVIAITNIATPVHIEALTQMLYRICCENIQAELESARSNNLLTAIKGHHELDNNIITYKINESLAIITFIEVEYQKHLSIRYFIEKLCSLIARNRKRICNEIRVEVLVIKETNFNAVGTFQNLSPKEAGILKFDQ
ncbi:19623_t:CDS:2, partial [Funneliformis geosporum]